MDYDSDVLQNVCSAEDAERLKVCPLFSTERGTASCQTESCMMWRWFDKENNLGYCGLAGKP